jgi:hypothetical protein
MSIGVFTATQALTNTNVNSGATSDVGPFVPEMWSDETLVTYKANLVLADLVTRMDHVGKKGDTVNIPVISARGAAAQRRPATATHGNDTGLLNDQNQLAVAPQSQNPSLNPVVIDSHFEYSVLIEDFADMQATGGLRRFYTDDAGFSLSRQVDWDLHLLGANAAYAARPAPGTVIAGSNWEQAAVTTGGIVAQRNATVIGSNGSTAWATAGTGNGASLADAGIRRMIRTLDDQNIPQAGRAFVVPPVEKENLLGIARFTEQAFVGDVGRSNSIRNGLIGELYDNAVFVSTNCPTIQAADSSTNYRACLYLHKDAFVLIMQMNMRSQAQYLQQYLSTLLTSDIAYGREVIRGENFVSFVVPA